MLRVIAHPTYVIAGLVGAKVTGLAGVYCAWKKKDIAGMGVTAWFALSAIYLLFMIASLLAQILLKLGEKDA